MYKNMICPIKSGAFGHEELFENTPGASNYHKRLVFDVLFAFFTHFYLKPS